MIPRMPETEAQRKARERNLAKGNPKAYKRKAAQGDSSSSQDAAQGAPGAAQSAAQGAKTYRARSTPATAAKSPRARRTPPRAPARPAQGAAQEPPRESRGGFLGGLFDALRG